jgi:hypothetical protein
MVQQISGAVVVGDALEAGVNEFRLGGTYSFEELAALPRFSASTRMRATLRRSNLLPLSASERFFLQLDYVVCVLQLLLQTRVLLPKFLVLGRQRICPAPIVRSDLDQVPLSTPLVQSMNVKPLSPQSRREFGTRQVVRILNDSLSVYT